MHSGGRSPATLAPSPSPRAHAIFSSALPFRLHRHRLHRSWRCRHEERLIHGGGIPSNVSFVTSSSCDVCPRNNPSHVSMSTNPPPPPPYVSSSDLCHRHWPRDDGCAASRPDDNFIIGNSNIPLKGGGGKGEDLTTNDSWESSSPSYCPPSSRTDPLLFHR